MINKFINQHILDLKKYDPVDSDKKLAEEFGLKEKDNFEIDFTKDLMLNSSSKYEGFLNSILQDLTIIKDIKSSLTFLLLYPIEFKASVLALSKNFK